MELVELKELKDTEEEVTRRQGTHSQKSQVNSGLERVLVELESIKRILE